MVEQKASHPLTAVVDQGGGYRRYLRPASRIHRYPDHDRQQMR
jgi:hypothetical protein